MAFKKKTKHLARWAKTPTQDLVQRLSRQLWEFAEQVRLDTIHREESA